MSKTLSGVLNGYGFFSHYDPLTPAFKKFKNRIDRLGQFAIRTFVALALPLTAWEMLGPSGFFEQLSWILKISGPYLFLVVAFADLLKWGGLLYRLYDSKTRQDEWQKLRNTAFISLYQPLILSAGVALFVASMFAPPLGLTTLGAILLLSGTGLSSVRYLIKTIKYKMLKDDGLNLNITEEIASKKMSNNITKLVITVGLTIAFTLFFFPVANPLISTLVALSATTLLITCLPSFIALCKKGDQESQKGDQESQKGDQKSFFTNDNLMHMTNLLIAFVGISFSIAAATTTVGIPFIIVGMAGLALSAVFASASMMPKLTTEDKKSNKHDDTGEPSKREGSKTPGYHC